MLYYCKLPYLAANSQKDDDDKLLQDMGDDDDVVANINLDEQLD